MKIHWNSSLVFVALATLLWGTTPAVGKLLLSNLNNLQVLLFISFFASLSLLVIAFVSKKLDVVKTYTLKDYLTFAYMGLLGVFLYYFFFFKALSFLSAQEASVINYFWPVTVVIFSIPILKEHFTLRKLFGILLSFIGVVIVISRGNLLNLQFTHVPGIAFAICGALAYGIFSVFGKKQNYERFTSTMFYYLFAFFYALIAVLLFTSIPHVSLLQLAGLLWLGIFTSGIAFVAWFLALKHGDTAKMSNVVFLTPFLSLIYIHFLIGETILVSSLVGLSIIIAGIVVQSLRK